jgi:gas vesicle protein
MSGIEIGIGVISAVAALITAYKDGRKIADRIKKKRAQRGGLPPSEELQDALKKGETNITRLRDEGASVQIDSKYAARFLTLS